MTDAQKWIRALEVIARFKNEQMGCGFFVYHEKGFIMDKEDFSQEDPEALKILEDNDWEWDGAVVRPRV